MLVWSQLWQASVRPAGSGGSWPRTAPWAPEAARASPHIPRRCLLRAERGPAAWTPCARGAPGAGLGSCRHSRLGLERTLRESWAWTPTDQRAQEPLVHTRKLTPAASERTRPSSPWPLEGRVLRRGCQVSWKFALTCVSELFLEFSLILT